MDPKETIDRVIGTIADELHKEFGSVATGDALVALEMCNADGVVGIAYLSNVSTQGQVQLLARVLATVSASDFSASTGTATDAE